MNTDEKIECLARLLASEINNQSSHKNLFNDSSFVEFIKVLAEEDSRKTGACFQNLLKTTKSSIREQIMASFIH